MDSTLEALSNDLLEKVGTSREVLKTIEWSQYAAVLGIIEVIPEFEGPIDDIVKIGLIAAVLRKTGSKLPVEEVAKGVPKGKRSWHNTLARAASSRASARGLSRAAYEAVLRSGIPGLAPAVSGAGAAAGYHVGGFLFDRLVGGKTLATATGGLKAAVSQTIDKLAHGYGRVAGNVPLGTTAILKALKWGAEEEKSKEQKEESLKNIFKRRSEQLSGLLSNPYLQMHIHEGLMPLRMIHEGVGDKTEMLSMQALQLAHDKMPKDPGTSHSMGQSRWSPSDREIRAWAMSLRAIFYPRETLKAIANGSVTPQEAEILQVMYPATFQEMRQYLLENINDLKLNNNSKTRLSLVLDIQLDSTLRPDYRQFVQQHYVERAAQASKTAPPVGGVAGGVEPKTRVEQLTRE
jgi:hypothetical protein